MPIAMKRATKRPASRRWCAMSSSASPEDMTCPSTNTGLPPTVARLSLKRRISGLRRRSFSGEYTNGTASAPFGAVTSGLLPPSLSLRAVAPALQHHSRDHRSDCDQQDQELAPLHRSDPATRLREKTGRRGNRTGRERVGRAARRLRCCSASRAISAMRSRSMIHSSCEFIWASRSSGDAVR